MTLIESLDIRADILKRGVLLAIDEIDGRRYLEIFDAHARSGVPHADELFGMRIGQRLQQDAFENAEDYGVRADACGESDQCNGREERGAAEASQNLSQLVGDHFFSSVFAGVRPSR